MTETNKQTDIQLQISRAPITEPTNTERAGDHDETTLHLKQLYFICNNSKLEGPYTRKQILYQYRTHKFPTSQIWIKLAADVSTEWKELKFPEFEQTEKEIEDMNDKQLIKQCEERNKNIKESFDSLYKMIEDIYLRKITKIEMPSDAPDEKLSNITKVLSFLGGTTFCIAGITFLCHNICSVLIAMFFVELLNKVVCGKLNKKYFGSNGLLFWMLVFSGTVIGPILSVYFILTKTEIYNEIQSWMIAYISWGIVSYVLIIGEVIADEFNLEKLHRIIHQIILIIVGIEFDVDFTELMGRTRTERGDIFAEFGGFWAFPSLSSVLPAAIVGFIANFILEEKFVLKCNEDIITNNTDLCIDEKYGCCRIVSSHDFQSSYAFLGGLASNMLAVWAIIRIIGYLMMNASPALRLYAKRAK